MPGTSRVQSGWDVPLPHGGRLALHTVRVMGIVNVTPDSFSDGGRFAHTDAAIAHGLALVGEGAAIIDVGGESTRPGATPTGADEELARVLPVIEGLRRRTDVPISIDTSKAGVAAAAIEAGASIVNDVRGFEGDPALPDVVARTGAAAILMHNRGHGGVDPDIDIVADVLGVLTGAIDIALRAGIAREKLIVDPGFGFGKTDAQNLTLVRDLNRLASLGCPILIGVSRKSSIGRLTNDPDAQARLPGSLAAALLSVRNGAIIVRVHDVAAHAQALKVFEALRVCDANANAAS